MMEITENSVLKWREQSGSVSERGERERTR